MTADASVLDALPTPILSKAARDAISPDMEEKNA